MSGIGIKRFYKKVEVAELPEGFAVHLDGRSVKTPAVKPLVVPKHRNLVQAIAEEWDAQGDMIRPTTMPITQLVATGLDRVGPERPAILEHLVAYAGTDLLCYRAQSPAELRRRQDEQWQPLVDWAKDTLGAELLVTESLLAIEQPEESLAAIQRHFDALDLWVLTAAQAAASAAGSAVLALALAKGRLNGQQVFDLSHVDEFWQIERWGDDDEAAQRRHDLHKDILAADRLLGLLSV